MKKLIIALILVIAPVLVSVESAMGYVYPQGYTYQYDYNSSVYGPMPYYSMNTPVYQVTGTYDPTIYYPGYNPPAYVPTSSYAYNYNYAYSYTNPVYVNPVYNNPVYPTVDGVFVDVSPTDSNYAAIHWLERHDIANGYENRRFFQPDKEVSRAELVAMVVKGRKITPSVTTYRYCFNDITTEWYANEICYAKAAGWLPSYTTNFYPQQSMTVSDIRYVIEHAFGSSYSWGYPSSSYMTRSQVAGLLYRVITGYGSYPSDANLNTNSNYYRYNPVTGDMATPAYCDGQGYYYNSYGTYVRCPGTVTPVTYNDPYYYNNYYDSTYYNDSPYYRDYGNAGYYNNTYYDSYYNNAYNNYYPRTVQYQNPWYVSVPRGYNGPWN